MRQRLGDLLIPSYICVCVLSCSAFNAKSLTQQERPEAGQSGWVDGKRRAAEDGERKEKEKRREREDGEGDEDKEAAERKAAAGPLPYMYIFSEFIRSSIGVAL